MIILTMIFETLNLWACLGLFIAGIVAFVISTISGGGGALLLIPVTTSLIGATATAPVVNLGTFISRPARLLMFWQDIDWSLVKFYMPSAILGAWLAGFLFSKMNATWLQLLIGIFLVSTIWQYRFGKVDKSFAMPKLGFVPLGFGTAFISTIVGGLGPVLNPFYMNVGLTKEDLIATKTSNSFFVGIAQISSYAFFGVLNPSLWGYGIVLGLGAVIGNLIGKRLLAGISIKQFRVAVITVMVVSGVVMIWQNLGLLISHF